VSEAKKIKGEVVCADCGSSDIQATSIQEVEVTHAVRTGEYREDMPWEQRFSTSIVRKKVIHNLGLGEFECLACGSSNHEILEGGATDD